MRTFGQMLGAARLAVAGLTIILLSGCDAMCSPDRKVVEIEYGSPSEELARGLLNTYQRQGYECDLDGFIRDGFGNTIGARYVCEKCD